MNNSFIALDNADDKPDIKLQLSDQEAKTIKIIDAIRGVSQSQAWSSLKTELFSDLPLSLRKDLLAEAKKDNPDVLRQRFIAGQLYWAEKYADLDKLENVYTTRLLGIRKNLNGTEHNG